MIEPVKVAKTEPGLPSLGTLARIMIPSTIMATLIVGSIMGMFWLSSLRLPSSESITSVQAVGISDTTKDIDELIWREVT